MKNIIIIISIFFVNIQIVRAQVDSLPIDIEAKVDSIFKTTMEEVNVPGAIITIVKGDEILLTKGYGYSDLENKVIIDPDKSQFRVASITKTFTALAIMDFVDQGKLDVHANINEYLNLDEFSFKSKYPITLHDIMTHSAGFEYTDFRVSKEAMKDGKLETYAKTSIPNQVYEPGTIFSYSNQGYSLLGHLIEVLSGMKYEDYMDKFVRERIGMLNSTFHQHTSEHQIANAVKTYQWTDGRFQEQERQFVRNPAASTLNTTGSDMGNFLISMLDNATYSNKKIISDVSYNNMVENQFQPPFNLEAHGYGVAIGTMNGMKTINHGGGIKGFLSYYEIIPEDKFGIFISQSTRYGADSFFWTVKNSIYKELLKAEPKTETTYMDPVEFEKIASNYEGLYQQYNVTQSTFEKGARIFGLNESRVKYAGNGTLEMNGKQYRPLGNHVFERVDNKYRQLGFTMDENGRAKYHSSHLHFTFKRVHWYQSILILRITIILGLIILLFTVCILPLTRLRKNKGEFIKNFSSKWIMYTASFFLFGFIILIILNAMNVSIAAGLPIGYKLGLAMTTLGGILAILSPYFIFRIWNNSNISTKQRINQFVSIFGIIMIAIIFWNLNLIGMNYY